MVSLELKEPQYPWDRTPGSVSIREHMSVAAQTWAAWHVLPISRLCAVSHRIRMRMLNRAI
jgi:hypothetical protein